MIRQKAEAIKIGSEEIFLIEQVFTVLAISVIMT